MSNYYLCDRCRHYGEQLLNLDMMPMCMGEPLWEGRKVMFDHGHANGRKPYDEPEDVCDRFEPREDQ